MSEARITLDLVGAGNVATHMARGFHERGVVIQHIVVREPQRAGKLAEEVNARVCDLHEFSRIESDTPVIIAVKDDAMAEVAALIPQHRMLFHTSGSVNMEVLSQNERQHFGVFYPLQTFSISRDVTWTEIPVCLEASDDKSLKTAEQLAGLLSEKKAYINSDKRRKLHLAAVMVNNFTNHLFDLSASFLQKEGMPFHLLHALINETAQKVLDMLPEDAQTGPARRKDLDTINTHLEMLKSDPELHSLYVMISEQIIKKYHE